MRRALLVVSFGTSVRSARKNIFAVEDALTGMMPTSDYYRVYTSPSIRKILQNQGEEIRSLEEQLTMLAELHSAEEVFIQPTCFICGREYDKIQETARRYAGTFRTLKVGKPLLSSQSDLSYMADLFSRRLPAETGTAAVLFGHGTQHFANMTYPALQTVLALSGRPDILVGTAGGWPGLDDVRGELKRGGYQSVRLVPLMLANGQHILNDMAGDRADSWKSVLEGDGLSVSCSTGEGLGLDPDVQKLYRQHLAELLDGNR